MPGGRTRVYIDASADQLEREIRRAELALERLGREGAENGLQASRGMEKATLATRVYAKTAAGAATVTSRVGSAARTAAPYVGAGLALGLAKSVAEAREATKALAQTEAAIKSTGGVANVTAEDITDLANAISLKSGIDDEAIQSSENLLLSFRNIRNEVGAGNDIFNQTTQAVLDMSVALDKDLNSATIQVGKALNDPIAGITALGRSGVQFTEQTREQIATLVEQGKTLDAQKIILKELTTEFGGSAAKQADSFDHLKVAAENFAEQVGGEVTPVLSDMADELSEILADKHLSGGQRIDKLADFFTEWAEKGIDALEGAAPDLARAGADIAGHAIGGFVHAWWNSDILGKLFLGAGVIRLLGGEGALRAAGVLVGTRFGKGVGRGVAIGALLSLPLLLPEMTKWISDRRYAIRAIGVDIGNWLVNALIDMVNYGIQTLNETMDKANILGKLGVDAPNIPEIPEVKWDPSWAHAPDKVRRVTTSFKDLGKELDNVDGKFKGLSFKKSQDGLTIVGKNADEAQREIRQYWRTLSDSLDKADDEVNKHKRVFGGSLGEIGRDLDRGGGAIDDYYRDLLHNLRNANARTGDFRRKSGDNYAGLSAVIGHALQTIGDNTNSVLGQLGAKKLEFSILQNAKIAKGDDARGLQTGGVAMVPGTGTGDSFHTFVPDGTFILNRNAVSEFFGLQRGGGVPVVLEPGELAFSPEAVAQMGGWLQWANGAAPRFASGGVAMAGTGVQRHYPGVSGDTDFIPALGNALSAMARATGHSIFVQSGFRTYAEQAGLQGGPNPAAAPGTSHHEYGYAADITPGNETFGGAAGKYGLTFPLLGIGEPWHIELADPNSPAGKAAAVARKIKRVMLDGPDGPLKSMGQGAVDKVWKAANAYIAKHQPSPLGGMGMPAQGGAIDAGSLPPALQKWNRRFPGAVLQNDPGAWMSLTEMPFNVGAAIAEWAGMPGVTMAQVSKGEGSLKPGSMGDDNLDGKPDGYGWLAITRPYGDSYGVDRYGGYEGMLNPVSNAIVAKGMYDSQGLGAWYGKRFVTDTNAHYSGPLLNKQRGGFVGMTKGGKPTKGGFTPTHPAEFGPGPVFPSGPVRPSKLTYEQQMTFFGIGLDIAGQTDTSADDLAILQAQLALVQAETDTTASQLANLHLTKDQREKARAQAITATAKLDKKLSKDGYTDKELRKLNKARADAFKDASRGMLDKERGELLDKLSGLTSELGSTKDQIESLNDNLDADNQAEILATLKQIAAEQAALNATLKAETTTQGNAAVKAFADWLNGQIGERASMLSTTAGYGSVISA